MPDGLTVSPDSNSQLATIIHGALPDAREISSARVATIQELQGIAVGVSANVKNKFPDAPEELVEAALDLVLGPLRLDEDSLTKERIKPNLDQLEHSATVQHTIADLVMRASDGSDPELSSEVFQTLKIWHELTGQRVFPRSSLPVLWRGTKSQIAIMRGLRDAGYQVILPDYTQDIDLPASRRQVLNFDVKSGIDLMGLKDGRLLLVDAKGRIDQATPEIGNPHEVDPHFEPNELVRESILSMNPNQVIRTKIYVPSGPSDMVYQPSPWPENPENPSLFLNNFARLRPIHHAPLVDAIARIDKVTMPINRNFA